MKELGGVSMKEMNDNPSIESSDNDFQKVSRAIINIASGAIPLVGGVLASISAAWSEHDQDRVNDFLRYRQNLLEKEIKEQLQTINEIMQRLEKIRGDVSKRIKSSEFQSLVEKSFRNWSDINTQEKREYIRNILLNAASTNVSSDEVIRLFIEWLYRYSDLHFQVIVCIYRHPNGISRGEVWRMIGKQVVREDSAEADLYKLLIRDLSTGGIIRQYRRTNSQGGFIKPSAAKLSQHAFEPAFDSSKPYVLTDLGQQFVHYAMSDVSMKLEQQTTSRSEV